MAKKQTKKPARSATPATLPTPSARRIGVGHPIHVHSGRWPGTARLGQVTKANEDGTITIRVDGVADAPFEFVNVYDGLSQEQRAAIVAADPETVWCEFEAGNQQ